MKLFTRFSKIQDSCVVIDWGKSVEYVKDMSMSDFDALVKQLRNPSAAKPQLDISVTPPQLNS